ncbi:hypothetical protein B9G55_12675 [Saccharibacillus sp. O16]|nr:hypothetical protein B9G55_12675 [Saccharibacillus sp. O16]
MIMPLKKIVSVMAISSLLLVPTVTNAEDAASTPSQNEPSLEQVNVQMKGVQPTNADLSEFVEQAREAASEYQAPQRSLTPNEEPAPETFDYTYVDGSTTYFYEKSSTEDKESVTAYATPQKTDVDGAANPSDAQLEMLDEPSNIQSAAAKDAIPGGIGGRATVQKNGNISTFVIHTPSSTTGPSSRTYIYGGFSGKGVGLNDKNASRNVVADMGLVYTDAYGTKKWQPMINYYWGNDTDGHTTPGTIIAPYNEVYYKNGYLPDQDVKVSIYKNLNNNTRLSTQGYAVHSNHDGTGGNAFLTSVTEIAATKVSSTTSWKYLATIADTVINKVPQGDAAGSVQAVIKGITIDNVNATPASDATDSASVSVNSNNVTIKVSK